LLIAFTPGSLSLRGIGFRVLTPGASHEWGGAGAVPGLR
jgi:hypothetical protein